MEVREARASRFVSLLVGSTDSAKPSKDNSEALRLLLLNHPRHGKTHRLAQLVEALLSPQ